MNGAGEGSDDHAPFGLRNVAIEIGENRTLTGGEAWHLGIGGIAEQADHALFTIMSQPGDIECFTIHRSVIKFEVARKDHRAHRGGDSQRVAIGHRVGVADELHRKVLAHLHHITWRYSLQNCAVSNTSFLHLSGQQRER